MAKRQKKQETIVDKIAAVTGAPLTSLERPSELKRFPEQISTLTGQQISDLHAHYTAWAAYISDVLKFHKADLTLKEVELKHLYINALTKLEGKYKTLKEKELAAKANPEYLDLELKITEIRAFVEALEGELANLDRQIMALRAELKKREALKFEID